MNNLVNQFINRRRPQAQITEVGIGGFTAFAAVRQVYKLQQNVPIIPLENGAIISDHLIKQPTTIEIEGELGKIIIKDVLASFSTPQPPFGLGVTSTIGCLLTSFQGTAIGRVVDNFRNRLQIINNGLLGGVQANSIFGDKTGEKLTAQQFIDAIEAIYYGGQLCTIDMPFRTLSNMAITSVTYQRDNITGDGTFSIAATQVTFADTQVTDISRFYKAPAPSSQAGVAGVVDKAAQGGQETTAPQQRSLLSSVFGGFSKKSEVTP